MQETTVLAALAAELAETGRRQRQMDAAPGTADDVVPAERPQVDAAPADGVAVPPEPTAPEGEGEW